MVVFGDGTQTRDFSYVSDTAAGILLAGEDECAVGDTINIGTGVETSVLAECLDDERDGRFAIVEDADRRGRSTLQCAIGAGEAYCGGCRRGACTSFAQQLTRA